jgi:CRISPR-associated protein Csb2
MGFDAAARRAFDGWKQCWRLDGGEIELLFLGAGEAADFGSADLAAHRSLPLGAAREWESLTPFIPTRHPKLRRNGQPKVDADGCLIGSPEHDLRRLLQEAGHPTPVSMEPLPGLRVGRQNLPWRAFRQERAFGGGRRAGRCGYGFRLRFDREVHGPLALGYAAHFGLGLFIPSSVLEGDAGEPVTPPSYGLTVAR